MRSPRVPRPADRRLAPSTLLHLTRWSGLAAFLAAATFGSACGSESEQAVGVATQALDELKCDLSEVTWDAPKSFSSVCEGPWVYHNYPAAYGPNTDLCGDGQCQRYQTKKDWVAGLKSISSKTLTEEPECLRVGKRRICLEPDGLAKIPCDEYADERRAAIEARNKGQNKRRNAKVVGTPKLTYLSGSVKPPKTFEYRCTVTIEYEEQRDLPTDVCAVYEPRTCLYADIAAGPVEKVSEPGLALSAVRIGQWFVAGQLSLTGKLPGGEPVSVCTSGENPAMPATERYDLLRSSYTTEGLVPRGSALHNRYIQRQMLMYEFYGDELSDSQREHARDLYLNEDDISATPTCGRTYVSDPERPECNIENWLENRYCTRLTSSHVSPKLVSMEYDQCLVLFDYLIDPKAYDDRVECHPSYIPGQIEAAIDIHDRLLEKLLLLFSRTAFSSDQSAADDDYEFNTESISTLLHQYDAWYFRVAQLVDDRLERASILDLALNKFWQVAHGRKLDGETGSAWLSDTIYGELTASLNAADAELSSGEAGRAQATINEALDLAALRGLALDRAVLIAAYSDIELGGVPTPTIQGDPLVQLTADALAPLADRLEGLVAYQDVGCAIADCANFSTPTPLSRFWKLLSTLGGPSEEGYTFTNILNSYGSDLSGWNKAFEAIAAHHERLLDSLDSIDDDAPSPELLDLIAHAQLRINSYEQTGQFLSSIGNVLETGVHYEQRRRIIDHVRAQRDRIAVLGAEVDSRMMQLVDGLLRTESNDTATAQLEAANENVLARIRRLEQQQAALTQTIGARSGDTQHGTDIMADWANVESALDNGDYLHAGADSERFVLSGSDADFIGWDATTTINELSKNKYTTAGAGLVSITVEAGSQWSPTCALSEASLFDRDPAILEDSDRHPKINVSPIGPEGYSLSWSNSSWKASSSSSGQDIKITAGYKEELCAGLPGVVKFGLGVSANACVYLDANASQHWSWSDQGGSDSRTSASFSSGLFLPTTPFDAPAGALVVVEVPAGIDNPTYDDIRDVHLIHSGTTTLSIAAAADLYLLPNDIYCPERDGAHKLTVNASQFVAAGEVAPQLLARMIHTFELVRARTISAVARGTLLPNETTEIRSRAKLDQLGVAGEAQITVDAYPPALQTLFYAYLDREIVLLEAKIALVNVAYELEIARSEYRAVAIALHNSETSGYMVGVLPRWSSRGLRLRQLREVSLAYTQDIRYYLAPVLRLWYPEQFSELGTSDAVGELVRINIDTPVVTASRALAELGDRIESAINGADLPRPDGSETAPTQISLRFPNPARMDPACADIPTERCKARGEASDYRWATVSAAKRLWEAIGEPGDGLTERTISFTVTPEDLYGYQSGTGGYIACTRMLPVVRRIGIIAAGYRSTGLSAESRAVELSIPEGAALAFTTGDGISSFTIAAPEWQSLESVPLIYASNNHAEAEQKFMSTSQSIRGVSPFTTFEFTLSESTVDEWRLRDARTLDLVFEVESVDARGPVAVPMCM